MEEKWFVVVGGMRWKISVFLFHNYFFPLQFTYLVSRPTDYVEITYKIIAKITILKCKKSSNLIIEQHSVDFF